VCRCKKISTNNNQPVKKHLLIVEDDAHIRLGLTDALRGEGYEVTECRDGAQAGPIIRQSRPDLVILDVMLPGKSGFEVCRELRAEKNRTPVLMLSAKGQEIDKVVGLELGADDYVTKPFSLRELLARVQALLRRATPGAVTADVPDEMKFGKVHVDCKALRGSRGKESFELTPRELKVLALLHRERGNAVSRDTILTEVWGIEYYGTTRTLDQLVVKLRQKIEMEPSEPTHLLTVHGLGYRLEA
jgi:DNA-binding response OmpR family regulator